MKKIRFIAAALSAVLLAAPVNVSAAITSDAPAITSGAPDKGYTAPAVMGGWTYSGSATLGKNPEAKAAFLKARKTADKTIEPVAYLGSQAVAGMNYCYLCRITPAAEARPEIALVYVYADLKGNASITGYQTIIGEVRPGSFEANEGKFGMSKNAAVKKAYEDAADTDDYAPMAYLGSQVVSGSNYMVLARGKGDKTGLYLVTIYADLKGNAEIHSIEPLVLGDMDRDTDTPEA